MTKPLSKTQLRIKKSNIRMLFLPLSFFLMSDKINFPFTPKFEKVLEEKLLLEELPIL